nr:hypothetical protein [Tanacetum cinerariifolium]
MPTDGAYPAYLAACLASFYENVCEKHKETIPRRKGVLADWSCVQDQVPHVAKRLSTIAAYNKSQTRRPRRGGGLGF